MENPRYKTSPEGWISGWCFNDVVVEHQITLKDKREREKREREKREGKGFTWSAEAYLAYSISIMGVQEMTRGPEPSGAQQGSLKHILGQSYGPEPSFGQTLILFFFDRFTWWFRMLWASIQSMISGASSIAGTIHQLRAQAEASQSQHPFGASS